MNKQETDSRQNRWARLRFSVVGQLLASPPKTGYLQETLKELSQKLWLHPTTSLPASALKRIDPLLLTKTDPPFDLFTGESLQLLTYH